jgi:ubiquitin carboxyl-terminal hydrolase 7
MDELTADETDKVITVFHFSKEPSRSHGVPFKFVVKPVSTIGIASWRLHLQ